MEAILVDDVRKSWGSGAGAIHALRGVSLRVEPGVAYGLLGRRAAGKSTLLRILMGLVRPSGGSVRLLGHPPGKAEARRSVGYLPEGVRFAAYRTGAGILSLHAQLAGIGAEARGRRVPEVLELVGLAGAAAQRVRGYGSDQRQRLALAQALVHEPSILLVDEPTAGLDASGRAEVLAVLLRQKRAGTTVLLGTRSPAVAERLCDRVAVLENGGIVREATPADLAHDESIVRIVTVPALDAVTRQVLEQRGAVVRAGADGFELVLRRADEIDRVVDLLRARGMSIRALEPRRPTLDEVLLRAVQQRRPEPAVEGADEPA